MNDLVYTKECLSTNDEILAYLPQKKGELRGIYTLKQTKGRGQYGNTWENAAGKNIALSLAVPAAHFPSDTFINFYTAVLARDFVANLSENEVFVKWPNDLLLHQKKIAGMLIEKKKMAGIAYYIIGIGLNVLQEDFTGLPKAGSLLTQTHRHFDPHKTAQEFFAYFQNHLLQPLPPEEVIAAYNEHLFKRNEVAVFEKNKIRQNGIIRHADAEGFLWIDLENDGLEKFFHKEISMLY